jgi:hypothetical protein
MQIDLTKMDDVQLATLAQVNSELAQAVADERLRRRVYPHISQGFQALFEAGYRLDEALRGLKKTEAYQAVKASGVLDVIERVILTAEQNGHTIDKSVVLKTETGNA